MDQRIFTFCRRLIETATGRFFREVPTVKEQVNLGIILVIDDANRLGFQIVTAWRVTVTAAGKVAVTR
ncbi:hypothetical protein D3C81_2106080 [compost metagenome]